MSRYAAGWILSLAYLLHRTQKKGSIHIGCIRACPSIAYDLRARSRVIAPLRPLRPCSAVHCLRLR